MSMIVCVYRCLLLMLLLLLLGYRLVPVEGRVLRAPEVGGVTRH